MKKDLPSVFANKIEKQMNNNRTYSISNNEEKKETVDKYKGIKIETGINQKINNIFSSPKYVYKADVIITTDDGEKIKRIIGKNGNNLITIENEYINIDTIKDIRFNE